MTEARDDEVWGMALASAGPYANNLHLTPDRHPQQHLITQQLSTNISPLMIKSHSQGKCQLTGVGKVTEVQHSWWASFLPGSGCHQQINK